MEVLVSLSDFLFFLEVIHLHSFINHFKVVLRDCFLLGGIFMSFWYYLLLGVFKIWL